MAKLLQLLNPLEGSNAQDEQHSIMQPALHLSAQPPEELKDSWNTRKHLQSLWLVATNEICPRKKQLGPTSPDTLEPREQ